MIFQSVSHGGRKTKTKAQPGRGILRKPEKSASKTTRCGANMHLTECIIGLRKLRHIFRYSARTRVIIEEKSVRIVQRMKNPAARKAASSF